MTDWLRRDVSHAFRSLRRRPLLSIAAVVSLALGIGVNTAIYSLFHRLVLAPLAIPAPDQIVLLTAPGRKPGATSAGDSGGSDQVFSYPLFRDLEDGTYPGIATLAAHRDFDANVTYHGRPSRADGLLVSGQYFDALRLTPTIGRLLNAADDHGVDATPVAVLGYSYWATHFGRDPGVLGQSLVINGEPLSIVGVGPVGFAGTTTLDTTDVFVPLGLTERLHAWLTTRRDHWLYLFARLAPGSERRQVAEAINGSFRALIRDVEFPALRDGLNTDEVRGFLARRIVLLDGSRGRQQNRELVGRILGLLFTVTGLVLLIACANIANLLMARAADRAGEIGVRFSLGASARSLVRLLLMELVVLATTGAVAGLVVARGTFVVLAALMPPADAGPLRFELNGAIVTFTILLGVGCGLLFGIFPALYAVSGRSATPNGSERASSSRRVTRFRTSLATVQIALATALLATASLLAASLANVSHADTGMQTSRLLTFTLAPSVNGYSPSQARALYGRVISELRGVAGIETVTATTVAVLSDNGWNQRVTIRPMAAEADQTVVVSTMRVETDYFRTLGIALSAGREFRPSDDEGSPRVAIVNRAFLRTVGGHASLGSTLALGAGERQIRGFEIVGIVDDAKYSNMRDAPPAQLYLPYRQEPVGRLTFYVRTIRAPNTWLGAIPEVIGRIDPTLPVEQLRTVDDQIWENVTRDRVMATLSSMFALLAVVLAMLGLYALLAFTVSQRLREFGIRMAVGASPGAISALVAKHVGRMVAVGTTIGLTLALGLGRLGEGMLYGVRDLQPILLGGAAVAMVLIACVASLVPTCRAARIRPTIALRAE